MHEDKLKNIIESALLASGRPLSIDQLLGLFLNDEEIKREQIREALKTLTEDYAERGTELIEVASGFRFQVREEYSEWVSRLWADRPVRYTRALLETLALIAYRQPITRGEIEDIRGVSVSSSIIKTLLEREWVRVVGHRDVPGKPAMYSSTKAFLDYFKLKSLDELPTLAELRDIDSINAELDLDIPGVPSPENTDDQQTQPGEEESSAESTEADSNVVPIDRAEADSQVSETNDRLDDASNQHDTDIDDKQQDSETVSESEDNIEMKPVS
ncbi:MAG TPA: SMC-Scp complex subunit ScpB [Gammaproteobacteria bacterium]|nr:SMC-Scp complex subunit ScpB [Gammaproteobacteria bacterium]